MNPSDAYQNRKKSRNHLALHPTPARRNRSEFDLSSTAYKDMTQKLCHFRPEDATEISQAVLAQLLQ